LSETLAADSADVGLFAEVQVTMLHTSLSTCKGLVAEITLIRSQAPVAGLHVALEVGLGVVGFIAVRSHAAVDTRDQFWNDCMFHLIATTEWPDKVFLATLLDVDVGNV